MQPESMRGSGHCVAGANLPKSALQITGALNSIWSPSSEKVRRGFCATQGSRLFWGPLLRDRTSVALGLQAARNTA